MSGPPKAPHALRGVGAVAESDGRLTDRAYLEDEKRGELLKT